MKTAYNQHVNTEGVSSAAVKLRNINDKISQKFDELVRNAKTLEQDWSSPAGNIACSMMYELFKNSEVRYSVIQNYINLLEQQVNPGYESAEKANGTLADQFR